MESVQPFLVLHPSRQREPAVPNAVLGVLILVATEVMFFAALISAFLIVKSGATGWPPAGQPRLPVGVTAVNTCALLLSGILMYQARRAFSRATERARSGRLLELALLFGGLFIFVQGIEWARLIGYGLTLRSSVYGSFFYLIIGAHGVHALGGLAALVFARSRLQSGRLTQVGYLAIQIFWTFVVGIWPVLYGLVYLS